MTCSFQTYTIQLVVFIQTCGLGGIIYYTHFLHRMPTSLDFYYATLQCHASVIYLFIFLYKMPDIHTL